MYQKGSHNENAEALSRCRETEERGSHRAATRSITRVSTGQIQISQQKDQIIQQVQQALRLSSSRPTSKNLAKATFQQILPSMVTTETQRRHHLQNIHPRTHIRGYYSSSASFMPTQRVLDPLSWQCNQRSPGLA